MRKISLVFAIIVLMAGVSVQAQKKNRLQPNPIGPPITSALTLEDQTGGGYIWFDMASGDFKCNMCEYSIEFGGTGQVKVDGFNVYLSAVTDKYQIFVSVNMWDRQGKAVMQVVQSPDGQKDAGSIQEFWTDLNIDDNLLNCAATK
jgi:hypothetical protein